MVLPRPNDPDVFEAYAEDMKEKYDKRLRYIPKTKIPDPTERQVQKRNGEIKVYNGNRPMSYSEFKVLPRDLKIEYLKFLYDELEARNGDVARMFGVHFSTAANILRNLGLENYLTKRIEHNDGTHGYYPRRPESPKFKEFTQEYFAEREKVAAAVEAAKNGVAPETVASPEPIHLMPPVPAEEAEVTKTEVQKQVFSGLVDAKLALCCEVDMNLYKMLLAITKPNVKYNIRLEMMEAE